MYGEPEFDWKIGQKPHFYACLVLIIRNKQRYIY